jgi:hypothetical protein
MSGLPPTPPGPTPTRIPPPIELEVQGIIARWAVRLVIARGSARKRSQKRDD